MPNYAGAKLAMRARFDAGWGATTPITYQNETPADPWPPRDADNVLLPWVNLEIVGTGSEIAGTGRTGNHVWHYTGLIWVHVFVPVKTGDEVATALAVQAGEIFRAAKFYNDVPGYYVRTLAPSIDDGDTADDEGNWFRCSASIPFTYWHRA